MTRQLTVTLETVTPMFLAGADNRTPELRPPSVRGQLRYWLRAALGALVGDNLSALKRAEAEVFGDTNGTGAVSVRVIQPSQRLETKEFNPLPHKSRMGSFTGFKEDQRFQIQLTQRGADGSSWLAAISALFLMVSIGGLGRRCRRGWGTIRIVQTDTIQADLDQGWLEILAHRPNSAKGWWNYISFSAQAAQVGIQSVLERLGESPRSTQGPSRYTIASPKQVRPVVVIQPYPTYTHAISDFGAKEHNWLQKESTPVNSIGYAKGQKRQASPLWVRVFPIRKKGKTTYILAATLFNIEFTGADYSAVKKFLESANFEVPQ